MANKAKRQKAKSQQAQSKQQSSANPSTNSTTTAAAPIHLTPVKASTTTAQSALPAQLVHQADIEHASSDTRSIRSVSSVTAVASPALSHAQSSTFSGPTASLESSPGSPGSVAAELLRAQIERDEHRHAHHHQDEHHHPRKLHKPKPRTASMTTPEKPVVVAKDQAEQPTHAESPPNQPTHAHSATPDGALTNDRKVDSKDFEHDHVPTASSERPPSISESILTVASEDEATAAAPSSVTLVQPPLPFVHRYARSAIRLPFAIASHLPIIGSHVPLPFSHSPAAQPPPSKMMTSEREADKPAPDEQHQQPHGIVFKTVELSIGLGLAGFFIAGAGAGFVVGKARDTVFGRGRSRQAQTIQ